MAEPRIDVAVTGPQGRKEKLSAEAAKLAGKLPAGPWFGMRLAESSEKAPTASAKWKLVGRPYEGQVAKGTAMVYLSPGNRQLTRPFIFADGFNYGPSDLPGLWNHLNKPYAKGKAGFLDQLRNGGYDIVLLGFDARHTHIQANAGVAIACINKAIEERAGNAPLTVGGVSMGGMITRYALAEMETQRMDHQTGTYLSYDTPHNGAWTPLILQQMAYFFEALLPEPPDGQVKQAELLRSPAAQQLLWGWVPDDVTAGPVTTNPLRQQLLKELERMGGFPQRPVLLGVANGTGNGLGRPLPPSKVAFAFEIGEFAGAEARIQPENGERMPIGRMALGGHERESDTSAVPSFDGAPGGTLKTYGAITDALGIPIEDDEYRFSCFVPSASAVALNASQLAWPDDLYTNLVELPESRFALNSFRCATENTEHSAVSEPLIDWIVANLVK